MTAEFRLITSSTWPLARPLLSFRVIIKEIILYREFCKVFHIIPGVMSATRAYIGAPLTISSLAQLCKSAPRAVICSVSEREQRWVVSLYQNSLGFLHCYSLLALLGASASWLVPPWRRGTSGWWRWRCWWPQGHLNGSSLSFGEAWRSNNLHWLQTSSGSGIKWTKVTCVSS